MRDRQMLVPGRREAQAQARAQAQAKAEAEAKKGRKVRCRMPARMTACKAAAFRPRLVEKGGRGKMGNWTKSIPLSASSHGMVGVITVLGQPGVPSKGGTAGPFPCLFVRSSPYFFLFIFYFFI